MLVLTLTLERNLGEAVRRCKPTQLDLYFVGIDGDALFCRI
jgi:hypothetical protein